MPESKVPELLEGALKFGIKPGLERISTLMRLLGDPQDTFKSVHIAGTNGKGSVATFISSIMAADNKKVGVFTSPYLERFSERIRLIDGREGLMKYVADDSYGEIDDGSLEKYSSQVGFHALLQRFFPTQGSSLCLLHCRRILDPLSLLGSPFIA